MNEIMWQHIIKYFFIWQWSTNLYPFRQQTSLNCSPVQVNGTGMADVDSTDRSALVLPLRRGFLFDVVSCYDCFSKQSPRTSPPSEHKTFAVQRTGKMLIPQQCAMIKYGGNCDVNNFQGLAEQSTNDTSSDNRIRNGIELNINIYVPSFEADKVAEQIKVGEARKCWDQNVCSFKVRKHWQL